MNNKSGHHHVLIIQLYSKVGLIQIHHQQSLLPNNLADQILLQNNIFLLKQFNLQKNDEYPT